METTQEFPYSYLYLTLANKPYFTYYLLCFFFYKIREQEGRMGVGGEIGLVGEGKWQGKGVGG
jgi:hypothetical protein